MKFKTATHLLAVLTCLLSVGVARLVYAQDITNLGGELTSPFKDRNAIQLPAPNVSDEDHRNLQLSGFSVFHRFVNAGTGLGPQFNHFSCGGCHVDNGRGAVVLSPNSTASSMIIKTSLRGLLDSGAPQSVPGVGEQLREHRLSGKNLYGISLRWRYIRGKYPDNKKYTLRKPMIDFTIPGFKKKNLAFSLRMTPPVIGPGLLEAIPEDTIVALSDPADNNSDGISGHPQYVIDAKTETFQLGRFGFKASHTTVEQQSAAAAFNDIGVTNSIFNDGPGEVEMTDEDLNRLVVYLKIAGVPAARNQDDPNVILGKALFQQVGCDGCHKMTLMTGSSDLEELANQEIHPFTDLLLHDMGSGLSDKRSEFSATGSEWRTTPLWGLGFSQMLSKVRARFLHDGRARSIEEAILWHGGEGSKSRTLFKKLKRSDRAALVAFLRSL